MNKKIEEKYLKIKTPEELLNFMSQNINYGYLGKNGKIYHYDDKYFNEKWFSEYILQNEEYLLQNLYGNCFDQVEMEREWFIKHGYEIKTIFEMVNLNYKNNYPTHTFLVYKDKNNNWNWFENADFNNRGIHNFNTFNELIKYQYNKYIEFLKTFNIKSDEIKQIIVTEFDKPKEHASAEEYLNHVINSNIIKKQEVII